jgi:hypothetical protein
MKALQKSLMILVLILDYLVKRWTSQMIKSKLLDLFIIYLIQPIPLTPHN